MPLNKETKPNHISREANTDEDVFSYSVDSLQLILYVFGPVEIAA